MNLLTYLSIYLYLCNNLSKNTLQQEKAPLLFKQLLIITHYLDVVIIIKIWKYSATKNQKKVKIYTLCERLDGINSSMYPVLCVMKVRGWVSINSSKYPVLCVMKVRGWVDINSYKYPVLCVLKVRGWVSINSSKYPVLCVMKVRGWVGINSS